MGYDVAFKLVWRYWNLYVTLHLRNCNTETKIYNGNRSNNTCVFIFSKHNTRKTMTLPSTCLQSFSWPLKIAKSWQSRTRLGRVCFRLLSCCGCLVRGFTFSTLWSLVSTWCVFIGHGRMGCEISAYVLVRNGSHKSRESHFRDQRCLQRVRKERHQRGGQQRQQWHSHRRSIGQCRCGRRRRSCGSSLAEVDLHLHSINRSNDGLV